MEIKNPVDGTEIVEFGIKKFNNGYCIIGKDREGSNYIVRDLRGSRYSYESMKLVLQNIRKNATRNNHYQYIASNRKIIYYIDESFTEYKSVTSPQSWYYFNKIF